MTHSRIGLTFHLANIDLSASDSSPKFKAGLALLGINTELKTKKGNQLLCPGLEVNSAPRAGTVHIFKSLSFLLLLAILKLITDDFFLIWFTHRDINVDNIPILKRSAETETEHKWWSTDLNKEKCENERPPTTTANPVCCGDKPHGAGAAGGARSDLCLSLITPHFMRNTGSKHCCLKISWSLKR